MGSSVNRHGCKREKWESGDHIERSGVHDFSYAVDAQQWFDGGRAPCQCQETYGAHGPRR